MKPELAASFIAAILFHALILFGFRLETSARPLAMSDDPSPVAVSLVEEEPAPALAALAPPKTAATPEPPEPQPTPEMSTPPPEPEPTPEEETMPAPESAPPKTAPRHLEQRRTRTVTLHSAPGTAAALAGTASHGAAGRGAPGTHAHYLSNPKPEYPEEAKEMRQQGVVVLSVEVGTDGHANDVSVSRSSGFPQLDQAAVRGVRRWVFEPARAAGLPVSSHVEVPVRFSLSE